MEVQHHATPMGKSMLVCTELPPGSRLVRIHSVSDQPFDRTVIVAEENEGETIFLLGWTGTPLSVAEWKEAADLLFPRAKRVSFERRKDGRVRLVTLALKE